MAEPASPSGATGFASASRLTVAVAEDHPVMREGLAALLAGEGGFAVLGSAGTARDTRILIERTPPHVLVMDLMPPRTTVSRSSKTSPPSTPPSASSSSRSTPRTSTPSAASAPAPTAT
jgi:DNA-binding NarL/FixJ family response regulator